MSLYAISDLHLSFAEDKSMEKFYGWQHYVERIEANWKRIVKPEDTVVLAGDLSWSLKLEDAVQDLKFVENLPGKKVILKGNHDYWWSTVSKIKNFFAENHFDSLHILHNNCYIADGFAVCGTRGWVYDGTGEFDQKVISREVGRLKTSLEAGRSTGLPLRVFLHYPPVYGEYICEPIFEVLKEYSIEQLWYGHIHGNGRNQAPTEKDRIKMRLISCDCVDFTPILIG